VLPNFFVIGAHKGGTTSLYEYLRRHPQVFMPDDKEPEYFTRDDFGDPAARSAYETLFEPAGDAVAIGEASTRATMFPLFTGPPERIAALVPQARFIYLLRDPVERMRSQYVDAVALGSESRPIDRALLMDAGYGYPSRYALQVDQYLRHHDRDRLLLITSEAMRNDRLATLRRVFDFLGVDPEGLDATAIGDLAREFNQGAVKRTPRRSARVLGHLAIRYQWNGRVMRRLGAMRRAGHPLLTRPIDQSSFEIRDDLRARLDEMLRPDVERLAQWMPAGFDGWSAGSGA